MSDVNWDLAPEGAEKLIQFGYLVTWAKDGFWWDYHQDAWAELELLLESDDVIIATRPQEPRKTVSDAYEYFDGDISSLRFENQDCVVVYRPSLKVFAVWRCGWSGRSGDEYEICTGDEF